MSSAQHSLACRHAGIVAIGRQIVHCYSSGTSRVASGAVRRMGALFLYTNVANMAKRWQMVVHCLGAEQPPVRQGTLLNFRMRCITHNLSWWT